MPVVIHASDGDLPPLSRGRREPASIRQRIVIRLDRRLAPTPGMTARRFSASVTARKLAIADVARARYAVLVPPGLDRQAPAGWNIDVEPAFEGAPLKDPQALWSYLILSLPAVRGDRPGWAWNLAHAIVQNPACGAELAWPESFAGAYKPLSGSAAEAAPGDLACSLRQIKVPQARAFAIQMGRPGRGEGILVGHLDTGWISHPQLEAGAVRQSLQRNMLSVAVWPPRIESASDAADPYDGALDLFHAHGLATASVLASRGAVVAPEPASLPVAATRKSGTASETGVVYAETSTNPDGWLPATAEVVGVASQAELMPVRCADSVVLTGDIELAQAVWYACQKGASVISMSLGGVPSPLLHAALAHAVNARNIIFCAAAGNLVPFVVFPAAYPEAIACAGSRPDGQPWRALYGSSFGPQVDISAPAQGVWTAHMAKPLQTGVPDRPVPAVMPGQGTSFATPAVAGAAAVWLAFHGRPALLARYPGIPLQAVFRTLLKRTAANPSGLPEWPADFGAGVLDLERLLREPLPAAADIVRTPAWDADAFLGYLADGIATVATAAAATHVPASFMRAMLSLEIAQLLLSDTDFGVAVENFANDTRQAIDRLLDDIKQAVENAFESFSKAMQDLFAP